MLLIIAGLILSYLLGSIPTAYIFVRLLKGADIRKIGSGNVGATNAMRVLGKGMGILVLFLDVLKGFIASVFLADLILARSEINTELPRILIGLACISGHNWTVFLQFKGGKGIATSLGVLLGLGLRVAGLNAVLGLTVATWLAVFILTRVVSVSSVLAGIFLPVYTAFFRLSTPILITNIVLAAFVIIRHRSNLTRLFQGKETRIF